MWLMWLALLAVLALLWVLTGPEPPPVLGLYRQPGRWYRLKYAVFLALMRLRQRRSRDARSVTGADAGYGMKSRSSIDAMDTVQTLSPLHPLAVDAVYFNGASVDGCWFVGATARRHDNLVQTLLYIRIADIGLLEMPTLPDTSLQGTAEGMYAAGGLVIEPVQPMKHWRLTYNGPMRLTRLDGKKEELEGVRFSLDWQAYMKRFDFDTDLPTELVCDAVAREPWNRQLFENLRLAHQTHYEQFGELSGVLQLGGVYGQRQLKVQGVRDHSYGNLRDWKDLHRYAIQYVHLSDGRALCIGNICMPKNMSRLIIGYVFHADGRMDAVTGSSLNLYEMGEDGNDPTDFEIRFVAGGKTHRLKGHVVDRPIFYMGRDWDARIVERMCTFSLDDSTPGWGISEWCYRNHAGKPEKH